MEKDLPSSDSSDEEYVPDVADADLPSEEESDGDDEEVDQKDVNTTETKLRKRGRRSKGKVSKKIKKSEDNEKDSNNEKDDKKASDAMSEVEKKKYEDDLWASFLGTSSTSTKAKTTNGAASTTKTDPKLENKQNNEKISITKVYNFAGEEVKVTKEIPKDSIEARLTPTLIASSSSTSSNSSNTSNSSDKKETSIPARGRGRGGLGISAVLGQIGKKSKISTLEKSKLDWDRFKQTEGLSEEIENFNKGKDGYLERQDFLQRTDLRQFEIEKQLRTTRKSNR